MLSVHNWDSTNEFRVISEVHSTIFIRLYVYNMPIGHTTCLALVALTMSRINLRTKADQTDVHSTSTLSVCFPEIIIHDVSLTCHHFRFLLDNFIIVLSYPLDLHIHYCLPLLVVTQGLGKCEAC
jgi:hypothetical protein